MLPRSGGQSSEGATLPSDIGGVLKDTWMLSTPLTRSRVWCEARRGPRRALIEAIIEEAEAQRELRKEAMGQIPARKEAQDDGTLPR